MTFTTSNPGLNPINDRTPGVVVADPNSGSSLQAALTNIFGAAVECGTTVNCGKFTGITSASSFGFFVKTPDGIYYSADSLNGGGAQRAYQHGSSSNWAVAFDIDGDADFNDVILYAESLVPVPDPGTMALLGSGLLAALRSRRLRRQRA